MSFGRCRLAGSRDGYECGRFANDRAARVVSDVRRGSEGEGRVRRYEEIVDAVVRAVRPGIGGDDDAGRCVPASSDQWGCREGDRRRRPSVLVSRLV